MISIGIENLIKVKLSQIDPMHSLVGISFYFNGAVVTVTQQSNG